MTNYFGMLSVPNLHLTPPAFDSHPRRPATVIETNEIIVTRTIIIINVLINITTTELNQVTYNTKTSQPRLN